VYHWRLRHGGFHYCFSFLLLWGGKGSRGTGKRIVMEGNRDRCLCFSVLCFFFLTACGFLLLLLLFFGIGGLGFLPGWRNEYIVQNYVGCLLFGYHFFVVNGEYLTSWMAFWIRDINI
jgi:hypothetical protein